MHHLGKNSAGAHACRLVLFTWCYRIVFVYIISIVNAGLCLELTFPHGVYCLTLGIYSMQYTYIAYII